MNEKKNNKESKPLMQRLLDAGYPKEDMFHHASDLYVYVNDTTTRVIKGWCDDNGFNMSVHCPAFNDAITGRRMYDCAFQYYDDGTETE